MPFVQALLIAVGCLLIYNIALAQGKSEAIVSLDRNSNTTPVANVVVPFDKAFTLHVLDAGASPIKVIYVYQSKLRNGAPRLVTNDDGKVIKDLELFEAKSREPYTFERRQDTLSMYFPALKPDQYFEIAIIRPFTKDDLKNAYALNEALFSGITSDINEADARLRKGLRASEPRIEAFRYDLSGYRTFYTKELANYYIALHDTTRYLTSSFLTMADLNYMSRILLRQTININNLAKVERIVQGKDSNVIFRGLRAPGSAGTSDATPYDDFEGRSANLQTSIDFFNSIQDSISKSLVIDNDPGLDAIDLRITAIITSLKQNQDFIKINWKKIGDAMSGDMAIAHAEILATSTVTKDLKSDGNNHFTMDFGLANVFVPDIQNHWIYMPKPYYGINYYFRAIDKNTRRANFEKKRKANREIGPDYDIAAHRDIRQQLSFSIGLTVGSISNKQFDGVIGSGILMAGLGYRLNRFFKAGAGVSLIKRIDKNPLISDKKAVPGFYINLAADLDVLQGVRDFINYFK